MSALWVVGDVHGAFDKLRALLILAGLTDRNGNWTGQDAHLVFLGDYLDRGPDGIGVIRLIQQLEEQAAQAGGQVTALIGNHEVMFLAAQRFRMLDPTDRLGFYEYWAGNGGQSEDMQRLQPADIRWLSERPALALIEDWLMVHADSLFYTQLGATLGEVNAEVRELLRSTEANEWGGFANAFVDRLNYAEENGAVLAQRMLSRYGGKRLVHGHSPVHLLRGENRQNIQGEVTAPIEYAGGLCVDVDSGMAYFPEAGFITRLHGLEVSEVVSLPEWLFARPPETPAEA